MRILRFILIHDFYFDLDQIERETQDKPFSELIDHCYKIGAVVPKSFSKSMHSLGCDCIDMTINPEFLKRWCEEQGIIFTTKEAAIYAVISHYKPDFVYIERCNWLFLDYAGRKELKQKFPFIKALILWIGVPPINGNEACSTGYDIIFCITPKMKEIYSDFAKYVYCTRSGIDIIPTEKVPDVSLKKKYPFTFLGTSGPSLAGHENRYRSLKYLLKHSPLKAWLHEPNQLSRKNFYDEKFYLNLFKKPHEALIKALHKEKNKEIKHFISGFLCGEPFETVTNFLNKKLPLQYLYPKKVLPPVYGKAYNQVIMSSQITLNLHLDAPGHGGNFRTFEAMSLGTCLLSDRVEEMLDFVVPDKDVVGFTEAEEALEKFNYLKDHPKLCKEIGENARKTVFSKHTIFHRCQEIIQHLNNYLQKKASRCQALDQRAK